MAFFFILFVSLCWEATIAVPCQWWGLQPRQMIGLTINGFSGLPVEEPILWVGITWPTVLVYETIYTLLYRSTSAIAAKPGSPRRRNEQMRLPSSRTNPDLVAA